MASTTLRDQAARIDAAAKEIDDALRQISAVAVDEFAPADLARFRAMRRAWARLHADAQEFADDQSAAGNEIVIMSGGT